MRFDTASRAVQLPLVLSLGFSVACLDGKATDPGPPRLNITVQPGTATVTQGDSSEIVAVVSANFKLVNAPEVYVSGAPAGINVRVSTTNQGINLASLNIVIAVAPFVAPGTYALQVHATNAARESPATHFSLTVVPRPECSQAAPCVQWARSASASSQYTSDQWSARQATGAPDVIGCSDNPKSWASVEPNTVEWLEVQFSEALVAVGVQVHENYATSSLVSVEVKDEQGGYRTVYTSAPALLACPSIRTFPVIGGTVVKAVRLTFDQRTLNDWNEVDAVGLVGYRVK